MQLTELMVELGQLSWVSQRFGEAQATWSIHVDAAATVHLATHSKHHLWHGELMAQALPDSPALNAQEAIAPGNGWADAFAMLADLSPDEPDAALVAMYRYVLPRHVGHTNRVLLQLSSPGDDAIRRVLWFALSDQQADLVAGSALVAAALRDEATVERALLLGRSFDGVFVPT